METTRTKAQPAEKLKSFRDAYEAFNRRDYEKVAEHYREDIVWHFTAGDVRGKKPVVAYAKEQAERLDAKLEPHDIVANDEHVVALLTYTVKGRAFRLIHVAHTDDEGNISEAWSFGEPELAAAVKQS